jgi:hypothetical protein
VFFYACAQCSSILLVSSWLLRKIQYMQGSSGFNTWREVLPLESVRGSDGARPARPAPTSQRPPSRYPADLYGKCFNCLSIAHRVATCRLPPHCLRCKGFRHLTRDCKQRRKVTFGAPMADHDSLYRSLPRATGRVPRAAHRMRLGWGRARLRMCLVRPLGAAMGASDGGAVNVGPEGRGWHRSGKGCHH